MKTKQKTETKAQIVTSRGADPELFIFNNESGEIVSAIDILNRDKYDPIDLGEEVTTYYDNAMIEFTIKPAFSKKEFVYNVYDALNKINTFLDKSHDGKYSLKCQASHIFGENELDHPEAQKIGCNPEFNAYTMSDITPPDFSGNLRSAGGHVAVGRADFKEVLRSKSKSIDKTLISIETKVDMVKLMDYLVGVPFTLIDNDSTSLSRRKLYGSMGSHRPKDFGIEYRVLSCYWIGSPKLVELVYDLSELAVNKLINGDYQKILGII